MPVLFPINAYAVDYSCRDTVIRANPMALVTTNISSQILTDL